MDANFTQNDVKILAKSLKSRVFSFNRNETILTDASDKNKLAFVTEGMVYLCAEDENFERNILRIFRPGDMFSVMMLPDEEFGVSYFVAKTYVKIIEFVREDLFSLAVSGAAWRAKVDALFAAAHKADANAAAIRAQRSIRNRFFMFLLDEAARQGSREIKLSMPYADIADLLGAQRSALMREIGRMKADGIIHGENRDITLVI